MHGLEGIIFIISVAISTYARQQGRELTGYSSRLTWNDAACVCRKTGTHLMMMKTNSDRAVIEHFINITPWNTSLSSELWLGLYDANQGKNPADYKWHDGDTLGTFAPWYVYYDPNEPNNQQFDFCIMADYLAPSRDTVSKFYWKSNSCAAKHPFVCERTSDCWMETIQGATLYTPNTTTSSTTTTLTLTRAVSHAATCKRVCLNADIEGLFCWAATYDVDLGVCVAYLSSNRFAFYEDNYKLLRKTEFTLAFTKCFTASVKRASFNLSDSSTVPKPYCAVPSAPSSTVTSLSVSKASISTAVTPTIVPTDLLSTNKLVNSDLADTGGVSTPGRNGLETDSTQSGVSPPSDSTQPTDSTTASNLLKSNGIDMHSMLMPSSTSESHVTVIGTDPVLNGPFVTSATSSLSVKTKVILFESSSSVDVLGNQISSNSTSTTPTTTTKPATTNGIIDPSIATNPPVSIAPPVQENTNGRTEALTTSIHPSAVNQPPTEQLQDDSLGTLLTTSHTSSPAPSVPWLVSRAVISNTHNTPLEGASSVNRNDREIYGSARSPALTKLITTTASTTSGMLADSTLTVSINSSSVRGLPYRANSTKAIDDESNTTTTTSGNVSTSDIADLNATTESSLSTGSNITKPTNSANRSPLCRCSCAVHKTREQQEDDVKEMVQKLVVYKKTTFAFKRKHTTASDPRPSATAVGSMGVVVIIAFFLTFVLLDTNNFVKMVNRLFKTGHSKCTKEVPDLIRSSEKNAGISQRKKSLIPPLRRQSVSQIPPAMGGAPPESRLQRRGTLPPLLPLQTKIELEKPKLHTKFKVLNRQGPHGNLTGPNGIPDIILQRHLQHKNSKHNTVGPAP